MATHPIDLNLRFRIGKPKLSEIEASVITNPRTDGICQGDRIDLLATLRAVLDLHSSDGHPDAPECHCGNFWPCETVRTIAERIDLED